MPELLEPVVLKSMHDFITVYTHNIVTGEITEPVDFKHTPEYIKMPTISRIKNGNHTIGYGDTIYVFKYDEEEYKKHISDYDTKQTELKQIHKDSLYNKFGLSKDTHDRLYEYIVSNTVKSFKEIETEYDLLCNIFNIVYTD